MLVLTRKLMEKLFIGDDICVTVVRLEGGQVRLGIDAPRRWRSFAPSSSPIGRRPRLRIGEPLPARPESAASQMLTIRGSWNR